MHKFTPTHTSPIMYISINFLLPFILSSSYAEIIRCYCNLPECETAKNTCQFEGGGCFSDFLDYLNITRTRHGCIHLLPKSQQDLCGNAPGSTGAPRSLLLCCKLDMCNHVLLTPAAQLRHSLIGSLINATEQNGFSEHLSASNVSRSNISGYNNHEVWLKAATIAVPICGAMILTILVVLACKILRADHIPVDEEVPQFTSNATCPLNQENSKKVPLLSAEDFRNVTTTRIHYGQHVNVLKECEESTKQKKIEKNVEYARVNMERREAHQEPSGEEPEEYESEREEKEEVNKREPCLTLNLDKVENVDLCNLYESPSQAEPFYVVDKCSKIYEKHLL